jgi:hypothetical protein
LGFLTDLHAKGVDLVLHQQGLDTSTPSGRAMFQMLGVFAEFERAMIREGVMTGLVGNDSEARPTRVLSAKMSLLPSDHPGTLLSLQRLREDGLNRPTLAGFAQQCVPYG